MSSVAATTAASEIQMDYMKLLVTQLQNQNPLEPLDNNEMASQLAMFSQLEQLESMNRSFSDVLSEAKREYAASLIGKEISFNADDGTGVEKPTAGVVEQVFNNIDGETVVVTGNHVVSLNDIISVKN